MLSRSKILSTFGFAFPLSFLREKYLKIVQLFFQKTVSLCNVWKYNEYNP